MTYSDGHVHGHSNGDIEQFVAQTVNVAAALPTDIPELPEPQIALSIVGTGPTMPTRQKLYGTYLSVDVAEQIAKGILQAVAEARTAGAAGLIVADEAGMRAAAAQADQVQALLGGPAGR